MLKRKLLIAVPVVLLLAAGGYYFELSSPKRDYFLTRPGELIRSEVVESSSDGVVYESLELESSTGLTVEMRVMRPALVPRDGLPVLIVIGGHRTGKNAVDMVGAPNGVAYAAIDYPYEGSHRLNGASEILAAVPKIQQAFLDTPPSLALALDWLQHQSWVDAARVELVGVSLGVPFAAVAGALNDGFSRVWLIHGGAENVSWTAHAGRDEIENDTLRRLAARSLLLLAYGESFRTNEWIREIAPRPLVIVAARNDDFVPPESQAPFIAAAEQSDTIELVWTDGLHVGDGRDDVLKQLLAIVLDRVGSGHAAAD